MQRSLSAVILGAAVSTLSACGAPKEPPKPLPPPPPVVVIPPQPMPPRGASPNFVPPAIDALGVHQTVNSNLSAAQTTWNLRSAYNVAALNCLQPQHAQIVVNYRAFLRAQGKKLIAVNKVLDNEFKTRYGARFVPPRETYMTQVYNYFALPPVLPSFCDAALAMSVEAQTVPPDQLDSFAARSLPAINRVFEQFFNSYDQYKVDLAAWQTRYTVPGSTPATAPQASLPPPILPSVAPAQPAAR